MSPRLFWLVLALLPAGLVSAQASVFSGPAAGPGDVLVYPSLGAAPVLPGELQGIVLLPVDATGRTEFTQFLPDQARLRTDVPFAARLILPHGQGALYRYRRTTGAGTLFGFFVVRPDGLAAPLAEFSGTGPQGTGDPVPNPVAIAGQGDAMLVATTVSAGGDVFLIELATSTVRPLTTGLPPLNVLPQGLILLPSWGVVLTDRGPLRFLRADGRPVAVPLVPKSGRGSVGHNGGTPPAQRLTFFGQGMAASADGSTVALIAGTDSANAHVFTLGPAGASVRVNDTPAAIADPGFGTQAGPTLALSPDGRRAAWKTQGALSGECFSRRVPTAPTPLELQITGDQNFGDTLNDTGVIAFFDPNSVVLLVGEVNGAAGIEKADLYRATFPLGGGAPQFANLTNTSGDGAAPFMSKGDLETSDGIHAIPEQGGTLYFVPGSSGQGELRRVNVLTGAMHLIRSGVALLDFVERAGSDLVAEIEHDQPAQRELLRVPFDPLQGDSSLGTFALSQTFVTHAGNADGILAFSLADTGTAWLAQMQLPSGPQGLLSSSLSPGPVLGFDGAGSVLTSIVNGSHVLFVGWPLGGAMGLYGTGPAGSFVLPAN